MREELGRQLRRFGQEMTMYSKQVPGGKRFFGRIEPLNRSSTAKLHLRTRAGGVKRAEFLLIAEAESFPEGETGVYIVCGGERFELLRADKMLLRGELCHWEGVLRLCGREAAENV